MTRIEIYERYLLDDKGEEYWENLGIAPPDAEYSYRRTMPFVDQIERPIEIVGNKKECIIRFWGGQDVTIKESYDDFCVRLHDVEAEMMVEQEMLLYEIANADKG